MSLKKTNRTRPPSAIVLHVSRRSSLAEEIRRMLQSPNLSLQQTERTQMLKHLPYILIAIGILCIGILPSRCSPEPQHQITQVTPAEHCNLCEFKEPPK